ncbi:MAG: hypothetical protein LBH34_05915 [Prevotellaceae bacterium]|jgi:hypothetical protein|nr:hypothetical protein [Prevotellaceae bacterium]
MSEIKLISDAIYDMDKSLIGFRRKKPLLSSIILILGIVCMIISSLKSMIPLGLLLVLTGAILLFIDLLQKQPYYVPTKERLLKKELLFDMGKRDVVRKNVMDGDFSALESVSQKEDGAIKVVIYKPKSEDILLAQVQEYIPHTYEPMTEIKVFKKGEYKNFR